MALFKRKDKGEADVSTVIGRRGIPATGQIQAMQPTGRTKEGGAAREFEFRLSFIPHGRKAVEVTLRQFMNELTLTGLEAGAEATLLYDRQDPTTVVVTGSPTYRIVSEGVAVKVEGRASGLSAPDF